MPEKQANQKKAVILPTDIDIAKCFYVPGGEKNILAQRPVSKIIVLLNNETSQDILV